MIAFLRGKIIYAGSDSVVLDVGGVGYEVFMDRLSLSSLDREGGVVGLYVRTVVREDGITLYGFPDSIRRDVFDHIMRVSGVGPKLAIQIIGGMPVEDFVRAVREKDIRTLLNLPGVGRKLADRLVFELSDKFSIFESVIRTSAEEERELLADVRSALLNLGFTVREVEGALRSLVPLKGEGLEDLIRKAIATIRSK